MTLTLLIHPLFQNPSLKISPFDFSFHEQQRQRLSLSLLIHSFSLDDVIAGGPRQNLQWEASLRQGRRRNQVFRGGGDTLDLTSPRVPQRVCRTRRLPVASLHPGRDLPFAGLVMLVGALLALVVNLVANSHVEQHAHVQYALVEKEVVVELDGAVGDGDKEKGEELAKLK
ncbi:hypothetical protein JHK84_050843 [Glycine max]|nr:hypothetical protein JHK84_050843 [Glycine max]